MSDPGNFGTVIGQGSLLEGTLLIDHGIRVDGTFRGRVTTPPALLVNAGGEVFLSHTRLDGHYTIRLAIGHIRTTEAHVRRAWELLVDARRELL